MPIRPSAQCVVALQLNDEQRQAYKDMPVVLDFASGFYFFEPDDTGVMKIAIHSGGYQYPMPSVSTAPPSTFPSFADSKAPQQIGNGSRTDASAPHVDQKQATIPRDQVEQMLAMLAHAFPELQTAPVVYTRVCFYSESHDENWLIDHAPGTSGLLVAGGDSGHAFKFLPTIGAFVCARLGLETVPPLTPQEARVWSFAHHIEQQRAAQASTTHAHQRDSAIFKGRL